MSQGEALPAVVTLDSPPVAVAIPPPVFSESQPLPAKVTLGGEKTVTPGVA